MADIFKCIFMYEKSCILIHILLKFVHDGSINNKWTLVQSMAWHRVGGKPLHEPMVTSKSDTMWHH